MRTSTRLGFLHDTSITSCRTLSAPTASTASRSDPALPWALAIAPPPTATAAPAVFHPGLQDCSTGTHGNPRNTLRPRTAASHISSFSGSRLGVPPSRSATRAAAPNAALPLQYT